MVSVSSRSRGMRICCGGGGDRVADVHVDLQVGFRGCEPAVDVNAHTAVEVLLANGFASRRVHIERQSVVGRDLRDVADQRDDVRDLIRDAAAGEVCVPGRPASVVGGEQETALEHERVLVLGVGEAGEEALQCVQREELVKGPTVSAGLVLQVPVHASLGRRTGRVVHSRISSAARSAGSAFGKAWAIVTSSAGEALRRRSHRRSASCASSGPSWCRSRKASMIERSAL